MCDVRLSGMVIHKFTKVQTRREWSDPTPASNPLYGVSWKVQKITRVGSHVRFVTIAMSCIVALRLCNIPWFRKLGLEKNSFASHSFPLRCISAKNSWIECKSPNLNWIAEVFLQRNIKEFVNPLFEIVKLLQNHHPIMIYSFLEIYRNKNQLNWS